MKRKSGEEGMRFRNFIFNKYFLFRRKMKIGVREVIIDEKKN